MSATEIIEEIKKLPAEEQQKIAVYIKAVTEQDEKNQIPGARHATDEEFERAADKVLRERAELFRKLAQ